MMLRSSWSLSFMKRTSSLLNGLGDVAAPAPAYAGAFWNLYPKTYSGPCLSVYKASDTTLHDIGFGSDGKVDEAAVAAYCGSSDGYLGRMYNQLSDGTGLVLGRASAALSSKIYDGATGQMVKDANGNYGWERSGQHQLIIAMSTSSNYGIMCRFSTTDTNFMILGNAGKNNEYIGCATSGSSSTAVCNNTGSLSVGTHYKNGTLQSIANRGNVYTAFATGNPVRYVGIAPLSPGVGGGNYAVIGEYVSNTSGFGMTPCFLSSYVLVYNNAGLTDSHVALIDAYLASNLL